MSVEYGQDHAEVVLKEPGRLAVVPPAETSPVEEDDCIRAFSDFCVFHILHMFSGDPGSGGHPEGPGLRPAFISS